MYLSHISITIPPGGERAARDFYVKLLGLREIQDGESVTGRISLDAGGLELHLIAGEQRPAPDKKAHLGLGCGDLESLKTRLRAAGIPIEDTSSKDRKFFTRDPFGHNLKIHIPGNFESSALDSATSDD